MNVINWPAWLPAIIAIISAVYVTGKLTNQIETHKTRIDSHDDILEHHSSKLDEHAMAIAKSQAWKDGYAAANDSRK